MYEPVWGLSAVMYPSVQRESSDTRISYKGHNVASDLPKKPAPTRTIFRGELGPPAELLVLANRLMIMVESSVVWRRLVRCCNEERGSDRLSDRTDVE